LHKETSFVFDTSSVLIQIERFLNSALAALFRDLQDEHNTGFQQDSITYHDFSDIDKRILDEA